MDFLRMNYKFMYVTCLELALSAEMFELAVNSFYMLFHASFPPCPVPTEVADYTWVSVYLLDVAFQTGNNLCLELTQDTLVRNILVSTSHVQLH